MPGNDSAPAADRDAAPPARRRAQEAVQQAMDRRDNGGAGAACNGKQGQRNERIAR